MTEILNKILSAIVIAGAKVALPLTLAGRIWNR